ncbi:SusC/RagA family TonB-linked outer membrane protein [Sphingobacterium griseoflavum]|uniref:SusC/RagA family TonB-linked outer membrane protein n=2 Tax=Sphingobacterium griseoflavum TaxID=1474952 RepID=A0ABQ3HU89_9SPHI|nr:SusC/RagA family TonB-linked outer membrane protein [Sphingobacterium griseoflavum]
MSQQERQVKGVILDAQQTPLEGASVSIKGTSVGVSTTISGTFTILVPPGKNTLVISNLGYRSIEVEINGRNELRIVLEDRSVEIEETVVVGYGKQRKESLVGAITQTSGEVLQRTGGVTNLGMALTGNLPGLVTSSSSGMPGAEDPEILIRAQTSWNSSAPLILVDGVERSMSAIDIGSVESISVLKDASATAVFGVKGANGVILITTKKGQAGKATIQGRVNTTAKVASRLPAKYDSYDALALRNRVVENELLVEEIGWGNMRPEEILLKYRFPANAEEWDRYANVDWEKELFRTHAMSYGANANVSGGTEFVTYFGSVDYVKEGDLFKSFENNRGYTSNYGYNRVNVRSNLDFSLTRTTKLSTKLFGSNGVRQFPWGADSNNDNAYWASAYRTAPDAMRPVYADGTWAWYALRNADVPNSVYNLAVSGLEKRTNTQLTTDFIINQELSMLTKGLSLRANYSLDNTFVEHERGINDLYNGPPRKWIDPETGNTVWETQFDGSTQLDYANRIRWTTASGALDKGATYRRINYSAQLNYNRQFHKHEVGAMGLFLREKFATGSMFPRYREDWVFRTTYAYDSRYLFEANGAYNGSEMFGPDYRFDFFPSLSAGWIISNEAFIKKLPFISNLKVRASWGKIGDDNVSGRWLYRDQWVYGGNAQMGSPIQNTPFPFYRISDLGNPNIFWENVEKRNLGVDYAFLNGMFSGSVDFFRDLRTDIIINGDARAIPSYFGQAAPKANLGSMRGKGYEFELNFNRRFASGFRLWINTNITHAVNEVLFRDDPDLLPNYQKQAGWQLGQTRSHIDHGHLASWDDIYGSTERTSNNHLKLPGDYNIIDFNGDGIIDRFDTAPYGYSGSPHNTYNASIGAEWKGLSLFLQFYGVNNVSRNVQFPTFNTYSGSNVAFVEGTYWTRENPAGSLPLPRWGTIVPEGGNGTRYIYDGSYLRLKNAEIAYTLNSAVTNRLGVNACRLYVNGNNLLLWTKMPDDRESNFASGSSGGAYPTVRRFNLGLDITF